MPIIIDELKKEHQTMLKALEDFVSRKPSSNEITAFVGTLKSMLTNHIKKEDDRLYPKLKTIAATNVPLRAKLNLFADEMSKVSSGAISFIEQYSKGGDAAQFISDLNKLLFTLKTRIRREEETLYPEYKEG